jgi:hypothetical protein
MLHELPCLGTVTTLILRLDEFARQELHTESPSDGTTCRRDGQNTARQRPLHGIRCSYTRRGNSRRLLTCKCFFCHIDDFIRDCKARRRSWARSVQHMQRISLPYKVEIL